MSPVIASCATAWLQANKCHLLPPAQVLPQKARGMPIKATCYRLLPKGEERTKKCHRLWPVAQQRGFSPAAKKCHLLRYSVGKSAQAIECHLLGPGTKKTRANKCHLPLTQSGVASTDAVAAVLPRCCRCVALATVLRSPTATALIAIAASSSLGSVLGSTSYCAHYLYCRGRHVAASKRRGGRSECVRHARAGAHAVRGGPRRRDSR